MNSRHVFSLGFIGLVAAACGSAPEDPTASTQSSALIIAPRPLAVVPNLTEIPTLSEMTTPANGDVNPYGVAFVPPGFPQNGLLRPGDVIVANFNNSDNKQGTGRTIVRVNSVGSPSLFFTSAVKEQGLSTALGVLSRGYVLVGNAPSTDNTGVCVGNQDNVGQGALQIIDSKGKLVSSLKSARFLDGPWDLTVKDEGARALVFVSNVKSGTVTRLDLLVAGDGDADRDDRVTVLRATQIASGYGHACDPNAFVVGPTGLALDEARDILYVASTFDNAIFAIGDASVTQRDAGRGLRVVHDQDHLHGPVGLALAPNGDLVSAQGDAINTPDSDHFSEIAEFTPAGKFVDQFQIDPVVGSAFGVAVEPVDNGFRFAAVDDGMNVLDLWIVR